MLERNASRAYSGMDCMYYRACQRGYMVGRWKGFSELMWQSVFSYDKKGPFHIWEDKTKEEKEECLKDLAIQNAARHKNDKTMQELDNGVR